MVGDEAMKDWKPSPKIVVMPGGSLDRVAAVDRQGPNIWIVDAHNYAKRLVVRVDEILTMFVEPESAIRASL